MLKIGLTGGIGSGKTLISQVFAHLGIPIYNADGQAKLLYNTHQGLKKQMTDLLGNDIYDDKQLLNRQKLAAIIFADQHILSQVNTLVHPAVIEDFKLWAKQQLAPYVIMEAAILFESKMNALCDKTITISCPQDLRVKRASKRDHVEAQQIEQRLKHQLTDEQRNLLADYVIINNGIQPLLPQILPIHHMIKKLNDD